MNTPTQCGAIKPPKTDIYLRSTSLASLRFCVEAGANMRYRDKLRPDFRSQLRTPAEAA